MKKWFKWIGIAVLTPFLLFIILAALIYLPPIQNWVAQKVVSIASEKTGMEISVGHVNLEFPLDLGIDDFRMLKPTSHLSPPTPHLSYDTIADVRKLVVNVRLLPLLRETVVIKELSFKQAKVNTNGFIDDLRVKGQFQELWLSSKGIHLDKETVLVNGAKLSGAQLDIALSDTAAVDTTESLKWIIDADSLSFRHTDITLHLPDDTLDLHLSLGKAVARQATANLATSIYKVGSLDLTESQLDYEPLGLNDVTLGIDSLRCAPTGLSLFIRQTSLTDKSGLKITELTGGVTLDSTYNHIRLPLMTLKTPDSNIMLDADMDFNAFDEQRPGIFKMQPCFLALSAVLQIRGHFD